MIRPFKSSAVLTGAALLLLGCGGESDDASERVESAPVQLGANATACPSGALPRVFQQTLPRNGAHTRNLIAEAVLIETNRARCSNGLRPLITNAALQQAAGLHSQDMARLNFFNHDSPVPGRETMTARVTQVGFRFQTVAENIIEARYMAYESGRQYQIIDPVRCAFAYADGSTIPPHTYASFALEVVQRWMESPGHRANLLNPAVREHGFALAPNRDTSLCGGIYATQVLAR